LLFVNYSADRLPKLAASYEPVFA